MTLRTEHQPGRKPQRSSQRGMVTVELAIGVLSLAVVTALMAFVIGLITLRGVCADVAAQLARELARDDIAAAEAVKARAPQGARIEVARNGTLITVQVSVDAKFGNVAAIPISANAVSQHE